MKKFTLRHQKAIDSDQIAIQICDGYSRTQLYR